MNAYELTAALTDCLRRNVAAGRPEVHLVIGDFVLFFRPDESGPGFRWTIRDVKDAGQTVAERLSTNLDTGVGDAAGGIVSCLLNRRYNLDAALADVRQSCPTPTPPVKD